MKEKKMNGSEVPIYSFPFLPLRIPATKKTKALFSLNLNIYRNAHQHKLNNVKRRFKEWFIGEYGFCARKGVKFAFTGTCTLEYRIFFPNRRRVDLGNVGSVIDKFVSDCLVECGYLPDDDRTVIDCIVFKDGGIDKQNPRAELRVFEV